VIRSTLAFAFVAIACSTLHGAATWASTTPSRLGIDVMAPVAGASWSGDRMRDARDRLKDILPGKRD
jgi:hypothetical protein